MVKREAGHKAAGGTYRDHTVGIQAGSRVHGPDCIPELFFLLTGALGDLWTVLVSPAS